MRHHISSALAVLLCFGVSTGLYPSEEPSFIREAIDTTISCLHWIICPYCLVDTNRQITKFQAAIDQNNIEAIDHVIRRRGLSPNQQLREGELPIIYAAKKAHVESVQQLLKLGSDVNSQMQGTQLNSYPSSLIAVCASANLPPERVYQTVKVLLDHGADPARNCVMLTEQEKAAFIKLREEFQRDPSKEQQILSRIPQDWFRNRTALDFAVKHKYAAAIQMIRQALVNQRKKGIKPDEQTDEHRPDSV